MIHIQDLANYLDFVITAYCPFLSENMRAPTYLALTDSNLPSEQAPTIADSKGNVEEQLEETGNLAEIFNDMCQYLGRKYRFTSSDEVLNIYAAAHTCSHVNSVKSNACGVSMLLGKVDFEWLQDIYFVENPFARETSGKLGGIKPPLLAYPNGLNRCFVKIWAEFLKYHRLTPCVILVTGNSKTGKTSLAQTLAERYANVKSLLFIIIYADWSFVIWILFSVYKTLFH